MSLANDPSRRSRQSTAWLAVILSALGLSFVLIVWAPERLVADSEELTRAEYLAAVNALRQSLIQLVSAAAIAGGVVFTARTYQLTRASKRGDRFGEAITQMSHDSSVAVRSGGVLGLLLLAREEPPFWSIVELVLASYIREHAPIRGAPGADIQAALTALGGRPVRSAGAKGPVLDLTKTNLRGYSLDGGNFERVIFDDADLAGSSLIDATLDRSSFQRTRLAGATMSGASLVNANLTGADLAGATLYSVDLRGANLTNCDLSGALGFEG